MRNCASGNPRSRAVVMDSRKNPAQSTKTARRANHFRFTEIDVKPEIYEDQKYFAFPEMKIMA
jgi:hypothetical protein